MLTFPLSAIKKEWFLIVAVPVHRLCMSTNQNACMHSTSCSQHYVNTPMKNTSAQNIIVGNL